MVLDRLDQRDGLLEVLVRLPAEAGDQIRGEDDPRDGFPGRVDQLQVGLSGVAAPHGAQDLWQM